MHAGGPAWSLLLQVGAVATYTTIEGMTCAFRSWPETPMLRCTVIRETRLNASGPE
jgi:hypothetical protein